MGAASAASLWGIKHFQDFKKASHPCKFESVNTVSYTNKMERYIQLDPLGAAFAASLRGIKNFQQGLPEVGVYPGGVKTPTPFFDPEQAG